MPCAFGSRWRVSFKSASWHAETGVMYKCTDLSSHKMSSMGCHLLMAVTSQHRWLALLLFSKVRMGLQRSALCLSICVNCRHHIERASGWAIMGTLSEEAGNINALAPCGSKKEPCMYTCIHCIIRAQSLKRMLCNCFSAITFTVS